MKRKIWGMLVMLVVVGVIGAMPVMAGKITAPDGYEFTTDNYGVIQIGNAKALTEFSKYVYDTGYSVNAVLTADIKLNEALNNNPTTNWETWGTTSPTGIVSWTPIGDVNDTYDGTFDGAGHTISGIYFKNDMYAQGFFGWCGDSANIKNLKITASYLKGGDYTGGIAGMMDGTITNCQVEATVVGKNNVGGLVGQANQPITGSSFNGSVKGEDSVGGVAGKTYESISNSYNSGSVEGLKDVVGGIAGEMNGSISNCYNTGIVDGKNNVVGGIAGVAAGTTSNCYNIGSVDGLYKVGGIAGSNSGSLANCYNTGNVSAFFSKVGAIVGANSGSLANCYYRAGSAVYGEWANAHIANGIGDTADTAGQTEVKTAAAFASGEVAWRLQNGQTDPAWGQQLTVDARPILKTTDKICQVTFQAGNGYATETKAYVNQNGNVTPPLSATGYVWRDDSQGVFTADSAVTGDISVRCGIATLPTATATYGSSTKLGDIDFVGGSVLVEGWSWDDADKETILLVGNTTAYPATYTPSDPTFDTETEQIIPVITTRSLNTAEVSISQPANASYSGAAIEPVIDVTDSGAVITNSDYTVTYANNTSPGTATVTITGQGNYQGTVTQNFTISARSLNASGVAISYPPNVNYTGAAIEPAITVTDSGAVITMDDYTVTYTNNTSPGTATVTIAGKGNYQDSVTRTFIISSTGGGGGGYTPPGMSGITVTPHDISFDPTGQLAVDIAGLPVGAVATYSLDGSSYTITPPAITRAGEHQLYIRITCPGYQDFTTRTTVTVAKQVVPEIPRINTPISDSQPAGSTDLGALLPADRGLTHYQLGVVEDPDGLLNGTPTIDANGLIAYGFHRHLGKSDEGAIATEQFVDGPVPGDTIGLATAAKTATIAVLVSMENYQDTTLTLAVSEAEPIGVRYQTHIQDIGWETDWVTAGELSGTSGQSKRLEALKVELTGDLPADASIETVVHVQNQGDLGPFAMGTAAGTSGKRLRLENITLTLHDLPGYSLRYNVHVQNQGWLRDEADSSSWFTSGEVAGTSGKSLRLEGIRMVLVKDE